MTFYWEIKATDDYIDQLSQLSEKDQSDIGRHWIEVATNEDPLAIGRTTTCPQGKPFVLVIFPGLAFEFIYELDRDNKIIRLINCERLTFLDHGQVSI